MNLLNGWGDVPHAGSGTLSWKKKYPLYNLPNRRGFSLQKALVRSSCRKSNRLTNPVYICRRMNSTGSLAVDLLPEASRCLVENRVSANQLCCFRISFPFATEGFCMSVVRNRHRNSNSGQTVLGKYPTIHSY